MGALGSGILALDEVLGGQACIGVIGVLFCLECIGVIGVLLYCFDNGLAEDEHEDVVGLLTSTSPSIPSPAFLSTLPPTSLSLLIDGFSDGSGGPVFVLLRLFAADEEVVFVSRITLVLDMAFFGTRLSVFLRSWNSCTSVSDADRALEKLLSSFFTARSPSLHDCLIFSDLSMYSFEGVSEQSSASAPFFIPSSVRGFSCALQSTVHPFDHSDMAKKEA